MATVVLTLTDEPDGAVGFTLVMKSPEAGEELTAAQMAGQQLQAIMRRQAIEAGEPIETAPPPGAERGIRKRVRKLVKRLRGGRGQK